MNQPYARVNQPYADAYARVSTVRSAIVQK